MPAPNWIKRAIWASISWMSTNFTRCYNRGPMRSVFIGLLLLLTVSSFVIAQRGQQPPASTSSAAPQSPGTPKGDDQTISVEVNLGNVLFTVADRKGKFVTNLRKDDFKVFEDDKIQTIDRFSSESN